MTKEKEAKELKEKSIRLEFGLLANDHVRWSAFATF